LERKYVERTILGARTFSLFGVWLALLLWIACYSDGAGFGGAIYRNACHSILGEPCGLVFNPVFPPAISWWAFVVNLTTLWLDGLYDSGLTVGFVAAVVIFSAASRMTAGVAALVFSWPVMSLGCAAAWGVGFWYELHRSLSTGIASMSHF